MLEVCPSFFVKVFFLRVKAHTKDVVLGKCFELSLLNRPHVEKDKIQSVKS